MKTDTVLPLPSNIYDGTETKAKVFNAIKDKLPAARLRVFEAIFELRTATDKDIKDYLGWEINRVTGRRKELQEMGLITYVGDKNSQYGHPNSVWSINSKALMLLLS